MPVYLYYCDHKKCKKTVEIIHLMSECDTPTEKIIKETTCPKHNIRMQRQIFEPQLAGASGGQFKTEKQLLDKKQEQRKLRSRAHFKNTVLPTLDSHERKHFDKKYKGTKKIDHEKL